MPIALHPGREFVHGLTLDWDSTNVPLGSDAGNWQEVQEKGRWLRWPGETSFARREAIRDTQTTTGSEMGIRLKRSILWRVG